MSPARTIVVTGVSRGIGRALVEGFVAQGHTVFGCARSRDGVSELRRAHDTPHDFRVVDISVRDQVDAWARDLGAAPDLLINNAGVTNQLAPLWQVPADEFESVIAVNVVGTANVIRAFLPAMIARGRGVVVNMSSGWGRSTSPEVAPYCASKHAVEGLTGSLAAELPQGLAAVAVSPGVINTDMLRIAWGAEAGSHPSPSEWALRAVPFFLRLGPSDNGKSMRIG